MVGRGQPQCLEAPSGLETNCSAGAVPRQYDPRDVDAVEEGVPRRQGNAKRDKGERLGGVSKSFGDN